MQNGETAIWLIMGKVAIIGFAQMESGSIMW